jgi:hypothetical protein
MPGLNLGSGGSVRVSFGNGMSNPNPPATASQAAFGTGTSGYPSSVNALTPNDPFGVAFWTAVIAAGLLLWIRHSLPA